MINKEWLLDAIDECECEPLTAAKREKLAQLYIIYDHLFSQPISNKRQTEKQTIIATSGDTDFLKMVNGKRAEDVWAVINELVATIQILQPALYNGLVTKIQEL